MRTVPPKFSLAPPTLPGRSSDRITFKLRIEIATAYLGGGVEAGVADALTPFRGASIRGHLRAAWRMTRGGKYRDAEELLAREGEIWGSTDGASPVSIEVLNALLGQGAPAKRQEGGRAVFEQPAYALFPAQSETVRNIYRGGSFDLQLTLPRNIADDVDAALRFWINFGGIGSRTRRGLGALYCADYSGLERWYSHADALGDGKPPEWPLLKGARAVLGRPVSWNEAWLQAIQVLRDFRQWRTRPLGRSRWPEPDAIRRLRGTRSQRHGQDITSENIFPRAALGLPIIFHFKDARDGDPADNTLVIDNKTDRMASPVIVKPMAISEREAVPLILALNSNPVPQLLLKQKGAEDESVSAGKRDIIGSLLEQAAAKWGAQVYTL